MYYMHMDLGMSSQDFRRQVLYQAPKVFKGAVKDLNITWK